MGAFYQEVMITSSPAQKTENKKALIAIEINQNPLLLLLALLLFLLTLLPPTTTGSNTTSTTTPATVHLRELRPQSC